MTRGRRGVAVGPPFGRSAVDEPVEQVEHRLRSRRQAGLQVVTASTFRGRREGAGQVLAGPLVGGMGRRDGGQAGAPSGRRAGDRARRPGLLVSCEQAGRRARPPGGSPRPVTHRAGSRRRPRPGSRRPRPARRLEGDNGGRNPPTVFPVSTSPCGAASNTASKCVREQRLTGEAAGRAPPLGDAVVERGGREQQGALDCGRSATGARHGRARRGRCARAQDGAGNLVDRPAG